MFLGHVGASAAGAFQAVYGGVTFQWGNWAECDGGGAFTASANLIKFASMAADWRPDKELRWRNLVVHELGHAFNQKFFGKQVTPAALLAETQRSNALFPDRADYPAKHEPGWIGPNSGFASPQNVLVWQMSVSNAGHPSEEFADMFLGWTFNTWEMSEAGAMRAGWMGTNMGIFIQASIGR